MAKILVLPGDGIGPEVTAQAEKVLRLVNDARGLGLEFETGLLGGAAIDAHGSPLDDATLQKARESRAILLGAVGLPRFDGLAMGKRPGGGLLKLRKELQLYANLRPAKVFDNALEASSLRPERVKGADIIIVRELTGGIYFGEPRGIREEDGRRFGLNTMIYHDDEILRIQRVAIALARKRSGRLTSVDKGNATDVGRFWREVTRELYAQEATDLQTDHMYVDNAALQIIRDPLQFDVMVMGNMFGDILSDCAGNIPGSLGMLPSASLGDANALYEPCHGSAPDIAGEDKANPIAAILSAAMLLNHTLGHPELEATIHQAVQDVLNTHCTVDLRLSQCQVVTCSDMGARIADRVGELL